MHTHKSSLIMFVIIAVATTCTTSLAANNPTADNPTSKAEALVHSLAAGDYTSAEADFNAQMQQGLPAAKLKEVWSQITAQAGAYLKTGETKSAQYQGDTIVLVKTQFKNGALWAQVAFDKSGKVAGLYFKPAD